MQVAERTQNGFDILDLAETQTSLIRQSNLVRLSFKDENNKLIQLIKTSVMSSEIGTLLVSKGDCLLPTGDKQNSRTFAKLLALPSSATETKQVVIDGKTFTARLLPVQIL